MIPKMKIKTALITGASSDIGQAVIASLAASGFNIAAHYHKNLAASLIIEDLAKKCGVDVELFCYDLIVSTSN